MSWREAIRSVQDVREFFGSPISRVSEGGYDCIHVFRQNFMRLEVRQRLQLMQDYDRTEEPYLPFVRDWGERINAKRAAGHYDTAAGEPMNPDLIWRDQGRHWIEQFGPGDAQLASALRRYEGERLVAARRASLAGLETAGAIRGWKSRWETHYRSGNGLHQTIAVPHRPEYGGGYTVHVAPLARWLIHRWDTIIDHNHSLSLALQAVGWYPRREGNENYRNSFQGGHPGDQAGELFFHDCTAAYDHAITRLGNETLYYLFGGRAGGGGAGARTTIPSLTPDEIEPFRRRVDAWGRINGSTGPSGSSPPPGLPAAGLPYGPPAFAESGLGGHAERIRAIYQIVRGGRRDDAHYRAAGLQNLEGGSTPPRMHRWF